jgi:hypothetical protein
MDDDSFVLDGCKGIRETDKAVLVKIPDLGKVWIAKSQIEDDSEVYGEGHTGSLVITNWLAEQKGWV